MGKRFIKFKCGHMRVSEPPAAKPTYTFSQADYPCDLCAGVTQSMRKHRDGKGFIVLYVCGPWAVRGEGDDRTVAPPHLSCEDCQPPHEVRNIPILGVPASKKRKPRKPVPRKDAGEFVRRKPT